MGGRLPFFWIKKSIKVFVGEDYRLGFILLKDLIKTGKDNSKIEFLEIRTLEGFELIRIKRLQVLKNIFKKKWKNVVLF